ncbi:MAG: hypothetical protein HOC70_03855 [Gammaproteobacteria bacterium]|jgi:quercetin dioxygenase-like cupin family protein|nr:hypothetical protein [Gammaproteobacteria bacterium]
MTSSLGKLARVPADLPYLHDEEGCVQFEFEHDQSYVKPGSTVSLSVLLLNDGGNLHCLMSSSTLPDLEFTGSASEQFQKTAQHLSLTPIPLSAPLPLEPVSIPKPWGQEIWYSGIEERGVSTTHGVPISWLLDVFGEHLGCVDSPLLLKILDPLPQENLGDLYFELHEHKTEVYIVTHVNDSAWPDGAGKIRYGFNQTLLADYPSHQDFLDAYLTTVKNYETVRRTIDSNESKVSDELTNQEAELRQAMYRFSSLRDVRRGDVITVTPNVPHSLQHGVRVVEFQTPHYERHILSFGQRVQTQNHWDTEAALKRAVVNIGEPDQPVVLGPGEDLIADFDEFRVRRLRLEPGDSFSLRSDRYQLAMGISGEAGLSSGDKTQLVQPETAWYLPPDESLTLENTVQEPAIVLIAETLP